MSDRSPSHLPVFPIRRFYVKDPDSVEPEGGEAWVEAESAVEAARMARLLWGVLFTGFSHEKYIDPATAKACRYDYSLEGTLTNLRTTGEQLEAQE